MGISKRRSIGVSYSRGQQSCDEQQADETFLPNRYNAKRRHWRKTRIGI